MTKVDRRRFIQLGGLGSATLGWPAMAQAQSPAPGPMPRQSGVAEDRLVRLSGDGLGLDPAQYARLLSRLADESPIPPDSYSLGGVVERLETECARLLGKEQAVFMPTGTLANHLAIRALAGGPSRVIVQEDSHLYKDEGDCAQTLSGLTLMPLATGRATFTASDVQQVLDETKSARVVKRVSVISIETPVRRKQGERFDAAELQKVVALAKREGIKLHLDGARLFLQAGYTGENVAETARPFDTVYVSLYKYFNAASGAILAGPRELLADLYHVRRMFGGGLSSAWPFAAVALHFMNGFGERYSRAVRTSEELIRDLGKRDGFAVERITSGTNLFRLRVSAVDPALFRQRLAARGVMLPEPQRGGFLIGVNETLNRITGAALADAFARGLV
jgi:threonine aldolase